ncbi:MAG: hypothetical protein LC733_07025 [Actinobacteria bacterium]|nr:hypothetical protein [Actinomycetota bacterium]
MPDLTESVPQGDPLKPRRALQGDAEPLPSELESRLDEVASQDLADVEGDPGTPGPDSTAPGAAFPGDDEGPSTAEGGQDAAGADDWRA